MRPRSSRPIAYRYFPTTLYGVAAAWGVMILSMLLVFWTFYRWWSRRSGEETWS